MPAAAKAKVEAPRVKPPATGAQPVAAPGTTSRPVQRSAVALARAARSVGEDGRGSGAASRARTMGGLQHSLGNARLNRMLTPELGKTPPPEEAKSKPSNSHPNGPMVQRKCACGGEAAKGGECATCQAKRQAIQRSATGAAVSDDLPPSVTEALRSGGGQPLAATTRAPMEAALGADLGAVRVHTGSHVARAARDISAEAFTHGQDIYFADGRYQPHTTDGKRLLAHELTHTVQQGSGAGIQSSSVLSQPGDPLEREAEEIAQRVVSGHPASPSVISRCGTSAVQRQLGEVASGGGEAEGPAAGGALPGTVPGVIDTITGISDEIWGLAKSLTSALGGVVSISGSRLVIAVPAIQVCPAVAVQLSLGAIPLIEFPIVEGVLPLSPTVELYGAVKLGLSLTPEISAQLGPCYLNGLHIEIDALGPSFSAGGSVSVTVAVGLGAELDAFVRGEVGMLIIIPELPIPIEIPVVGAEVGLAGQMRAIGAATFTYSAGFAYGGGTFRASREEDTDIGLAADIGIGAFGQIDLLGVNLCRLYWPFWQWHGDMGMNFTLSDDLEISTGGPSASLTAASAASISKIPFNTIPLALDRRVLKDDCPLCDALYLAKLMPTQRGGAWPGHSEWPWPIGPLPVYERDPGIPSKAKCRGACGPDCDTCKSEKEHRVCEETGDGCHVWWVYPNYQDCGTHLGCRNHDACYDWCAEGGETSILGPCHRVCDFECICDYNTPQCVGWIGGDAPHDGRMVFSDMPRQEPGCRGPCPKESKVDAGPPQQRLCLPDVTVFPRHGVLHKDWSGRTGETILLSVPLEIPEIPPPTLDVFVRAEARAAVDAGIGPVTIEGLCLTYDPAAKSYSGAGELHLKGDLNGLLQLTGILGAKAGWGCLLKAVDTEVLRGEVGLVATGIANLPLNLVHKVAVSCRAGQLMLDAEALFNACLKLKFTLDALIRVLLFKRFEIFRDEWHLAKREWEHCWDIPLGVTSGVIAGAACGGGAMAGVPASPGLAGPPAVLSAPASPGSGASPAPLPALSSPGGAVGAASPELGISGLNLPSVVKDLLAMAGGHEVIHDKKHGGLPDDPAGAAGEPDPCGPPPSGCPGAPKIFIDPGRFPESAKHTSDAIASGRPDCVTIDRPNADSRRASSVGKYKSKFDCDGANFRKPPCTQVGQQYDEYPQALFLENGGNADVRPINARDNGGSGASIGNQCRPFPEKHVVRIVVAAAGS
jgi:hypothetical protein